MLSVCSSIMAIVHFQGIYISGEYTKRKQAQIWSNLPAITFLLARTQCSGKLDHHQPKLEERRKNVFPLFVEAVFWISASTCIWNRRLHTTGTDLWKMQCAVVEAFTILKSEEFSVPEWDHQRKMCQGLLEMLAKHTIISVALLFSVTFRQPVFGKRTSYHAGLDPLWFTVRSANA